MGQLNEERREKNVREVTERLVEFTRIASLNVERIFLQSIEEQKLPEAVAAEESAQREESDGGEAGFRNLNEFVKRDRIIGWISDGDDRHDGNNNGEDNEGEIGDELSSGGGVVESVPFEADSEVAKLVGG